MPLPCPGFAYTHLPSAHVNDLTTKTPSAPRTARTLGTPSRRPTLGALPLDLGRGRRRSSFAFHPPSAVAVLGALGALVVRLCENARRLSASNLPWYRHGTPAYSPPTDVPQWHRAEKFLRPTHPRRPGLTISARPDRLLPCSRHGTPILVRSTALLTGCHPTLVLGRPRCAARPTPSVRPQIGSSHGAPGRPLLISTGATGVLARTGCDRETPRPTFCGHNTPHGGAQRAPGRARPA